MTDLGSSCPAPVSATASALRNTISKTSALDDCIARFDALLADDPSQPDLLRAGEAIVSDLVSRDNWLAEPYAQPADRYRQYLLHLDGMARYSIVSFVWGSGQSTPIHDHRVWGLIGMLRGAEADQRYRLDEDGRPIPDGNARMLHAGSVARLSTVDGDIHQVSNAFDDRVSISIHVYGGDIAAVRRLTYDPDGRTAPFFSAYADPALR